MAWYGMDICEVWNGVVQYGMVEYGMARCGMVIGEVWYAIAWLLVRYG